MNDTRVPVLSFLSGGGEMAERIRAHDWSATSLGPMSDWPESLLVPLSMMLPSKAQIMLFWGAEFVGFYNDAYRPVLGAKHPWALGRPGREIWNEIWDSFLHDLLAQVRRTGEAYWAKDMLFPLERNGFVEETYFDVSYDPVRDASGEVVGLYCIVTETTERVIWERRLALLKDLGAHNATARTLREACEGTMKTFAARSEDIPWALFYADGVLQCDTPGAETALRVAPPAQYKQLSIARTAGREDATFIAGLNLRRPFDDSYATFVELLASQLATALASAEAYEDERKRAEALAELDRAKTAFFSNVSHEFRTPLTLLLGPLEDLSSEASLPPGISEKLQMAHRNGMRLLKLVNTLLDFSRIEAGRARAAYRPTDLSAYTSELASVFRSACERAGLRLTVDCSSLYEPVYVDREMWEKVVLNLLSNAFKFTFDGTIEVALRSEGSHAVLTVSDTGTGIPAHELEHVFERFHRVAGAKGRTHEGSGIGLALVRELVRLHGGEIFVQSTVDDGSCFSVRIPFGAAHLQAEHIVEQSPLAMPTAARFYAEEALGWLSDRTPDASVGHLQAQSPVARRERVLVADDNADMRDYLARLLAEQYEVEAVTDGEAAWTAALERPPALILSDAMMPQLDGFGLLKRLRADVATKEIPVIMLSARAGEEARVEGIQAGADDYMVKPFGARELLARVAGHLQMAQMRREAGATLRQSEERYRALVSASSDVVYRMSPDWNEMLFMHGREFMADTPEPSRGWMEKYIFVEDREWVERAIDEAIDNKRMFQLEHRVLRVDGSLGWTSSRAVPLLDEAGEIVEWFGTASDITTQKAAEEALREADRRKDEFLATLSHELRNPLAPLRNGVQILQLTGEDAAIRARTCEIMERQLGHVVRLVDDLLEMSRITTGALELRRERVELGAIVRNAIEASEPAIQAGVHRFEVSLPGAPVWIEGDPVRLAQVLSNLLNNAAKYSDNGAAIRLAVEETEDSVRISVRDTGRGIARDALGRIFDLFWRERVAGKTDEGGLGIGLTLALRLVELHGGKIEALSDGPGRGAEFIVRLPRMSAPARRPGAAKEAISLAGFRVLVVDDNQDGAESLSMVLRMLGADVHVAFDGASAIAAFGEHQPEAVVLDIGLPDIDGYQVAQRLRAEYREHNYSIVALTGWGQAEDMRRSRAAGIDRHLVKPVDSELLARAMTELRGQGVR